MPGECNSRRTYIRYYPDDCYRCFRAVSKREQYFWCNGGGNKASCCYRDEISEISAHAEQVSRGATKASNGVKTVFEATTEFRYRDTKNSDLPN